MLCRRYWLSLGYKQVTVHKSRTANSFRFMKDKFTTVESGDVILRELIDSDLVKLSEYANNEKVSVNLRDAFPKPYTFKDAKNFKKMIDSQNPKTFF